MNLQNLLQRIYPTHRWRKRIIIAAKILVVFAAMYILGTEIRGRALLDILNELHWDSRQKTLLTIFMLLAFINMGLDAFLWKSISAVNQKVSFATALFHHLCSLSLASITPYNVGEFGGKQRQYQAPLEKLKAVYLTYVFRFVKMSARNLVGALSLLYLVQHDVFIWVSQWQAVFILIIALVIVVVYFQQERIIPIISGIVVLGKKIFLPLGRILPSTGIKIRWLILGLLKFMVYPLQFLLALMIFEHDLVASISLMAMIWLYYSLSAFLPSIQAIDPLVKGGAGIFILTGWVSNPGTILLATTLVWFINVAIPAFIGALFFLKTKKPN